MYTYAHALACLLSPPIQNGDVLQTMKMTITLSSILFSALPTRPSDSCYIHRENRSFSSRQISPNPPPDSPVPRLQSVPVRVHLSVH